MCVCLLRRYGRVKSASNSFFKIEICQASHRCVVLCFSTVLPTGVFHSQKVANLHKPVPTLHFFFHNMVKEKDMLSDEMAYCLLESWQLCFFPPMKKDFFVQVEQSGFSCSPCAPGKKKTESGAKIMVQNVHHSNSGKAVGKRNSPPPFCRNHFTVVFYTFSAATKPLLLFFCVAKEPLSKVSFLFRYPSSIPKHPTPPSPKEKNGIFYFLSFLQVVGVAGICEWSLDITTNLVMTKFCRSTLTKTPLYYSTSPTYTSRYKNKFRF